MNATSGKWMLLSFFLGLTPVFGEPTFVDHTGGLSGTSRPAINGLPSSGAGLGALNSCFVGQGAFAPVIPSPPPVFGPVNPLPPPPPVFPPADEAPALTGSETSSTPPDASAPGGSTAVAETSGTPSQNEPSTGSNTPQPPAPSGDVVKLLSGVFNRCNKCHDVSTSGGSIADFSVAFGAEDGQDVAPGKKSPANLLNTLKTVGPMKGIYNKLSADEKKALETWVAAAK